MINRQKCFSEAFAEQKSALNKKNAEYYNKIEDLKRSDKEFSDILLKISSLGAQAAGVALSGDTLKLENLSHKISQLSKLKEKKLKENGIFPIKFDCGLCKDTGYISGKICPCIKKRAEKLMLEKLSKELPINESGFDNFDLSYYPEDGSEKSPRKRMEKIYDLCLDFTKNFDPEKSENLLFLGSAGLGKTHLSLAIVKELINKGFDCIYASAYNLFSAMENDHFSSRSNETYEAAISCDLLVIDDLGSEFTSPFILSCIYNVINTRLLSKKPTVISTNLTISEIESRYTPRISSRFIGNYNAKKFWGEDIRQIKMIKKGLPN